jgi:hypothetical protein
MNAERFPAGAHDALEEAAVSYDRMADRLGRWDLADPKFGLGKQ